MAEWRNRIVEAREVDPNKLVANPKNWRIHSRHQEAAMTGVMAQLGWIQDVIVNRQTGKIVDGHLRVSLAIKNRQPTVPVKYVDLTPEEEAVALATFDPIGSLATADAELLKSVLADAEIADNELRNMLAELSSIPSAPEAPPINLAHEHAPLPATSPSSVAFVPTLNAPASRREATEDDVAEAKQKMREMIWKAPATMKAACPKCGADFLVERP